MVGCQSFYLIEKYKCGLLPGSCYVVAMGLWVVARMLLCDCYGVVGGCQAFYMFLSDLIQEYWWLPDCFYLIDMKNVGGCQEVAVWLLWGCGWLS